ncbi:MAG TPA: T9SS type A sorting domain-containing protein, partial [Candidatus Marinimicrobia bacterium]|nr:T9SS type A sorting domain-containing protein [Candidatus Neomarinimicrobiota bacterium]HQE96421.1 T9SS type A sorting domain-containing protein [Candidatus Neomarinimicrobiota bacterium]
TESEIENLGFIIQKRLPESGDWLLVADYTTCEALAGHGSTSEAHEYSYTDAAVIPGATYLYRLGDVDYKGKVTWHKEVEVKVEAENAQVPLVFGLKPAYPNPFNPSVTIPYGLAEDGQMSLKVYNLRGELVEVLISTYALKGTYSYNWSPQNLSAGIYLVRLQSGNHTSMQKIVFVK